MFQNKTLNGRKISLLQIQPEHRELLRVHAQDDRVWKLSTIIACYSPDLFNTWFTLTYNNTASELECCYSISYKDQLIGSSRYYSIKKESKEICIGYTWINPTFWGSFVNPEIKYLMLKNAFEQNFDKIYFHVDNLNIHSQTAMKKLGAEVVPGNKWTRMRLDGSFRDTVEYVVTREMWPSISAKLQQRILES